MKTKRVAARILAVVGTVLVWFPIAFMAITSFLRLIETGQVRIDFLLPFELFPATLAGILMVMAAALLTRTLHVPILWLTGGLAVILAGGALFAKVSGLAAGTDEEPWSIAVLTAIMVLAILVIAAIGVFGILLAIRLIQNGKD